MKYENMTTMDFVKMLAIYKGCSLRKLLKKLHEEKGHSECYANFYNKLKHNTIRFNEMSDIAKRLGYSISFDD